MATSAKARRSFPRWLLAIEFSVVVLIVSGGCYFKQNYQVLSPQMANESFSKCSVVIEGRVVYTYYKYPIKWEDYVFFCWPFGHEGPLEPNRYDLSIEIDKILKETPSREGELTRDERFKKIFAA